MNKPAPAGDIWEARATLYNIGGKAIGTCIDTPNAIAKAFLELREANYVKDNSGLIRVRAEYAERMQPWNKAQSGLQRNEGAKGYVDEFNVPTTKLAIAQQLWHSIPMNVRLKIRAEVGTRPGEVVAETYKRILQRMVDAYIDFAVDGSKLTGKYKEPDIIRDKAALVLWGRKSNTTGDTYVKLTDRTSNAEIARWQKDGWEVLRYPVGESPNKPGGHE